MNCPFNKKVSNCSDACVQTVVVLPAYAKCGMGIAVALSVCLSVCLSVSLSFGTIDKRIGTLVDDAFWYDCNFGFERSDVKTAGPVDGVQCRLPIKTTPVNC